MESEKKGPGDRNETCAQPWLPGFFVRGNGLVEKFRFGETKIKWNPITNVDVTRLRLYSIQENPS